ncbi:MAG: diaminopimelate epimerase [Mogibacterium sp.]|nr:diaminopimelate epimerase [Mogibacterium sp.]
MRFTKMQGCGNDYIYVNCFEEKISDPSALAVRLSDRHYGIGSDGLILIEPSAKADAYMHMFNIDGSEGRMCGNGVRCVTKYIYDHALIHPDRRNAVIDTLSGLKEVSFDVCGERVSSVTVDMGIPQLTGLHTETVMICGKDIRFTGVDTGNPHAVVFLEDNNVSLEPFSKCETISGDLRSFLAGLGIEKPGRAMEQSERFPDGVNTEFICIVSRKEICMRVWERGSGETLACGTGATASVYAGIMLGRLEKEVLVHLKGGDLVIRYDEQTGRCYMTGPAVEVFTGDIQI